MVLREVFRELCFTALHFGPAPPPPLLGIRGAGAHDTRPPRSVVRVVMRTFDRET
jgi:hypothetical protein